MYVVENGVYNASTNDKEATFVEAKKTQEDELFFTYKGADGILRSDLIPLNNAKFTAIKADNNATKLRKVSISLAGDVIPGQDYVLGINFKNFFSSGDDSQYYKDAAVHATSADSTHEALLGKLKTALNLAFSREDGATATENPYLSFTVVNHVDADTSNNIAAAPAKLVIEEKEQPWVLGTMKQKRVMFDVFPGTVFDDTTGDDVCWAALNATTGKYFTEEASTTTVGNGKKIADLEWFCAGERGDQYRGMGYPNVIPTKYYAASEAYHLIEIHYAFTDTGVNSYRTEKEITIAVPKGASSANYTAVNAVITALNTAAGTTLMSTLS